MHKSEILSNMDKPAELEKLYRSNKSSFKAEFNRLYPDLGQHSLAEFWHTRLNYQSEEISWGSRQEIIFVILASLTAGLIAKLPAFFDIDPDYFYPRFIGFILFPFLICYFAWKKGLDLRNALIVMAALLSAFIFIYAFPDDNTSDTFALSCIHLPLFLWAVSGFTFLGKQFRNYSKRLDFLRFNGDLAILGTLILIAGAIFSGLTVGLFSVIGYNIEEFYIEYIVVFGLAAVPIIGTYIVLTNPQLVNKVSPVIAKIFSPLVLITLVIYLFAFLYSGKDPYRDRDFLILFNFLLIGVMAIILFSITETFRKDENRASSIILLALSVVTVIVNGIALSAILYRISEWGVTPNRLAVMGGNILMLMHLLMISAQLIKNVSKKSGVNAVENSIAKFLPLYIAWTIIVTFIFPFLFNFN